MSRRPPPLALPMIRVGGVEYVKREHFDIAAHAAQNNLQVVRSLQRDRDSWKAKYNTLVHARRKRK